MKLKVSIAIFIVTFLGLFFLLYANGSFSSKYAYSQMASQIDNPKEILEPCKSEDESVVETELEREHAVSDSIFEICKPAPLIGVSEIIIKKKAYIVSYNQDTKIPNWVAWHLTGENAKGIIGRSNTYFEDNAVPLPRATLQDYKGSGWSRGHMCPAGDNKWDETAMYESFSLINICPQNANLNSGLWNSIEIDCRNWAKQFGDIYIVCGPLFLKREHVTIGDNQVFVPEAFFKVILCLNEPQKGFGFVVRNTDGNKKRDLYYNSIDQVERITGIDFFPVLPDELENDIESQLDMDLWK